MGMSTKYVNMTTSSTAIQIHIEWMRGISEKRQRPEAPGKGVVVVVGGGSEWRRRGEGCMTSKQRVLKMTNT